MGNTSKTLALILILMMAILCARLLTVKPAYAQSTPTPSVPQFTLQLVGPPVRVNTTYSLDTNTGQIVAKIGYTNEYSAVNITIKNQFFSDLGSNTFYYNVRIKPHNSADNWTVLWTLPGSESFPRQSNSEYTIIPLGIDGPVYTEYFVYPEIPVGTEIDIQVEAMIGVIAPTGFSPLYGPYGAAFSGETSAWSSTQTVTVPENIPLSPTPAPSSSTSPLTPTETPTSTTASSSLISFLLIASTIVIAFLLAVIVALLLYIRKQNRLASAAKKDEVNG
jgi:hypothetical protein